MKAVPGFMVMLFTAVVLVGQTEDMDMVVQMSHINPVTVSACSDTGMIIATTDGREVKLWSSRGYLLRTLPVPAADIRLTSDGSFLIAAAGRDIHIFETATGNWVKTLQGHTEAVFCIDISNDDSLIASGSKDSTVMLWTFGGRLLRVMDTRRGPVNAVAFSPDDKKIFSGIGSSEIYDIYDIRKNVTKEGKQLFHIDAHGLFVWNVDGTFDSEFDFFSASINTIDVSEERIVVGSGSMIPVLITQENSSQRYRPVDCNLRFFDHDGQLLQTIKMEDDFPVSTADFSSDGASYLFSTARGAYSFTTVRSFPAHEIVSGSLGSCGLFLDNTHVLTIEGRSLTIYDVDHFISRHNGRVTGGAYDKSFGHIFTRITDLQVYPDGAGFAVNSAHYEPVSRLFESNPVSLWPLSGASPDFLFMSGDFFAVSPKKDSVAIFTEVPVRTERGFLAADHGILAGYTFNGEKKFELDVTFSGINSMVYEESGEFLYVFATNSVNIFSADGSETQLFSADGGVLNFFSQEGYTGHFGFEGGCLTGKDGFAVYGSAFRPEEPYEMSGFIMLGNRRDGFHKALFGMDEKVLDVCFPGDGRFVTRSSSFNGQKRSSVRIWSPDGGILEEFTVDIGQNGQMIFDESNGNIVISHGNAADIFSLRGERVKSLTAPFPYSHLDITPDGSHLVGACANGVMSITHLISGNSVTLFSYKDEWIMFTRDGYFTGSKNCADLVAMVRGNEAWGLDQFALLKNRPDVVLQRIGLGSEEMIELFKNLFERRRRHVVGKGRSVRESLDVPRSAIEEIIQDRKYATLSLSFNEAEYQLEDYTLFVNDVPVVNKKIYGKSAVVTETVELSAGPNKIEVSCRNSRGAESYRSAAFLDFTYYQPDRTLYFIGFGVSEYRDITLNLEYAHKDAEDLAELFSSLKGNYDNVVTRVFTDSEVTRSNIQAVKSLLRQAAVDDTVVLFISGHGVHDSDTYATYYYLTHETDLHNLSRTAVRFDELEDLLRGIPPRQKLFLMDTCGSGEWRPEMIEEVMHADSEASDKGVWSRMVIMPEAGSASPDGEGDENTEKGVLVEAGKARPYLADRNRYIYNDVMRRTGAIVFSSCRGDEVSYENSRYENGIFTEYLLEAFTRTSESSEGRYRKADADSDGIVSVDELSAFVTEGVTEETERDSSTYTCPQHPVVDRDNIYIDFGF